MNVHDSIMRVKLFKSGGNLWLTVMREVGFEPTKIIFVLIILSLIFLEKKSLGVLRVPPLF